MIYVSVTGLRVTRFYHAPRFWWHAIRSLSQAQHAEVNLSASTRTIDGVHHTLSAWTDEAAMRRYLKSGAHLSALRVFRAIATGSTVGFVSQTVPGWEEALRRWREDGRPS